MIQIAFYGFSFFLLISALAVVLARNPVHSVLCLIFTFFNAAGLFILLGAEFIALILIVVYVGAVAVLFLFVVMMMRITSDDQRPLFSQFYFYKAMQSLKLYLKYSTCFTACFISLIIIPILADLYQQGIFRELPSDQWFMAGMHSKWFIFAPMDKKPESIGIVLTALFISRALTQQVIGRSFLAISPGFFDSISFLMTLGLVVIIYFTLLGWNWIELPNVIETVTSPLPPLDLMGNIHAIGQILYVDYVFAFQCAGIILLVAMIGVIMLTFRVKTGVKRQDPSIQVNRQVEDTLELIKVPLGEGVL